MTEKKQPAMKFSKYEKARIIGSRALQISMGATFMIKLTDEDLQKMRYSPVEIAKLEYEKGLIPMNVERPMPQAPKKEIPQPIKEPTQ